MDGANLRHANLEVSSLHSANLRGADLTGAKLIQAELTKANLVDAILVLANLHGADLRDVDLQGANLENADIRVARLPTDVIRLNLSNESKWDITIMHGFLRIGSECHSVAVWDAFNDEEIAKMDKRLLPFWAVNKQKIMAVANAINNF